MPTVRHKRGTSANLAAVNPVPLDGEIVYDQTENAIKIGDGATAWSSLAYVTATPRSHTHLFSEISDITFPSPLADNSIVCYTAGVGWGVASAIGTIGVGSQPLGGWPAGSVGASLAGKASLASPTFTGTVTVPGLTSTGVILADDAATANSVVYSFDGDPNTGVGRGGADIVTVVTAGSERVRVDAGGNVGIGAASTTATRLLLGGSISGAGTNFVLLASPTAQSAVTTLYGLLTFPSVAADCALNALYHYAAQQGTTVAGTVSTQIGFWAHSGLTSATNNYGFRADIASGTGRWNFFANGSAPNFFLGNVGIGSGVTAPTAALDINADTIRLRTARTPASPTAAGNAGDICWDANFVYVCTATNTWRKAAITADGTQSIADDSVTYAKLQNVSATDRLLGRSSAGAGDVQEITCTPFGRSLIDDVDAAAARGTLGAAPTASPTFTGTTTFNGPVKEGYVPGGNTGTAKTIALTNGTLQDYTLTGNCTFTMPSPSPGLSFTLMLRTGAGNYTATFTGVRWPGNSAPVVTTTANRTDLFTFINDGGNWYGNVVQGYAA